MTYALGRSLTHEDMPTVRRVVREAAAVDYRFSAIVAGIAESPQMRAARLPGTQAGVVEMDAVLE
jgi:hypothetical protein